MVLSRGLACTPDIYLYHILLATFYTVCEIDCPDREE